MELGSTVVVRRSLFPVFTHFRVTKHVLQILVVFIEFDHVATDRRTNHKVTLILFAYFLYLFILIYQLTLLLLPS